MPPGYGKAGAPSVAVPARRQSSVYALSALLAACQAEPAGFTELRLTYHRQHTLGVVGIAAVKLDCLADPQACYRYGIRPNGVSPSRDEFRSSSGRTHGLPSTGVPTFLACLPVGMGQLLRHCQSCFDCHRQGFMSVQKCTNPGSTIAPWPAHAGNGNCHVRPGHGAAELSLTAIAGDRHLDLGCIHGPGDRGHLFPGLERPISTMNLALHS
jgi:hypothetical protein